jgi:hypothetical protein
VYHSEDASCICDHKLTVLSGTGVMICHIAGVLAISTGGLDLPGAYEDRETRAKTEHANDLRRALERLTRGADESPHEVGGHEVGGERHEVGGEREESGKEGDHFKENTDSKDSVEESPGRRTFEGNFEGFHSSARASTREGEANSSQEEPVHPWWEDDGEGDGKDGELEGKEDDPEAEEADLQEKKQDDLLEDFGISSETLRNRRKNNMIHNIDAHLTDTAIHPSALGHDAAVFYDPAPYSNIELKDMVDQVFWLDGGLCDGKSSSTRSSGSGSMGGCVTVKVKLGF